MSSRIFSTDYWEKTNSVVEFKAGKLYPRDIPVTAVKLFDINSEAELLLVNTPKGWDIPGGHLENNETAAEALTREIKEETGGLLRSYDIVGYLLISNKQKNEHNLSYPSRSAILVYAGEIINTATERASLQFESDEVRRFPIASLGHVLPNWSRLSQEIVKYIADRATQTAGHRQKF